jgi:tRNA(Met) cytidine acetyltransferase
VLPQNDDCYPKSLFYKRLLQILANHKVSIHTADDYPINALNTLFKSKEPASLTSEPLATPDQRHTIDAIKKVVTGHRNRPLVITSNRGRGKSSAIGLAIRELFVDRPIKIIICAPTKAMVAPVMQFAGKQTGLHFVAPDRLAQELPKAGLVIIDEAGAIPVPLLSKLLRHYSRMVFSTTLHGYEGNGRGFAIRFYDQLNTHTPNWRLAELSKPIRWKKDDPLEEFTNDLLLLNAEPSSLVEEAYNVADILTYQKLAASGLANDEALLRQFFGLLVIAHYQTRPSDLIHLLDDPQISIHAIFSGDSLVVAAIISHEGGLSNKLAKEVYNGQRRPKGHLVPQILLSQMGIMEASTLKTDRIMRIATHPLCRRQKLASRLLDEIAEHSTADYLSTSFGLSQDLLPFWCKAGYHPVYLGLKREASSGYHSAVMLHALSNQGLELQSAARQSFARNITTHLGDVLKEYDPELAYQLLVGSEKRTASLFQQEIRDINRFAEGQCGLEPALAALQHWLPGALIHDKHKINKNEAKLLIMRIVQHHSWAHCCEKLGIPGKQVAQQLLQQTVSVLVEQQSEQEFPRME